jgi:4-hydroxybenzoate polyprenyltransferase
LAFEFLRKVSQFIKIEHTVFDLPFIFSGAVIASRGAFLPVTFLLILMAAVSARAAGMSINRIEGRRWDRVNPRKKDWVLVNGKLSLSAAIALTVVFSAIFELVSYSLNYLVFLLSPIVLFMFITDPIMKRITPWRHVYMGATIGMGVMGGYLAVTPLLPSTPQIYLIFLSSTLWIAGFDMIYVIPDIETDQRQGLKTVMTRFGTDRGLLISTITHALSFGAMLIVGLYLDSFWYFLMLVPILALMILQHRIIDPENPSTVKASFFGANSVIGFLFLLGIVLSYSVRSI